MLRINTSTHLCCVVTACQKYVVNKHMEEENESWSQAPISNFHTDQDNVLCLWWAATFGQARESACPAARVSTSEGRRICGSSSSPGSPTAGTTKHQMLYHRYTSGAPNRFTSGAPKHQRRAASVPARAARREHPRLSAALPPFQGEHDGRGEPGGVPSRRRRSPSAVRVREQEASPGVRVSRDARCQLPDNTLTLQGPA